MSIMTTETVTDTPIRMHDRGTSVALSRRRTADVDEQTLRLLALNALEDLIRAQQRKMRSANPAA